MAKRKRKRMKSIQIAIGTEAGGKTGSVEIQAHVFGCWAAHKTYDILGFNKGWRVSHVPSGLSCVRGGADGLTYKEATTIAKALYERIPDYQPKLDRKGRCSRQGFTEDNCVILATVAEAYAEGDIL